MKIGLYHVKPIRLCAFGGMTEVLEGLFGGYKHMVGENKMSLNGLGRLILCMSSRIGEFSEELVHRAMTSLKCKDINAWLNQAFMKNDKKTLEKKSGTVIQGRSLQFLTPHYKVRVRP